MMITDGRACCDCTTCAQGTCLRLIANLEQRLQKRVIVVGSQLLSILQHSDRIPSLDTLKAQDEAQAAAAHEAPVAWTAIGEEGAAIARRCAAILCAAGASHFELGLIDLVAGEVDPEAERARAQEQQEGPSTAAALLEGMVGMPPRPPPRIRVPLSCFDLEAVHAQLAGGCLFATSTATASAISTAAGTATSTAAGTAAETAAGGPWSSSDGSANRGRGAHLPWVPEQSSRASGLCSRRPLPRPHRYSWAAVAVKSRHAAPRRCSTALSRCC